LTLKVVYYGCALSGKTTNLETLHRWTDPKNTSGLVSIATKDDRTLFFDLLPIELGQIGGFQFKVKVYTIPGQVHYELTRRQVLSGADGVVMVVDSDPQTLKANAWAIDNLRLNLKANGLDPQRVPMVLQWNKRDLPGALPVPTLSAELNPRGLPEFESVATTGIGVVETFGGILKAAIANAYSKSGRRSAAALRTDTTVDAALEQIRARQPAPDRSTFTQRFDVQAYADHVPQKVGDATLLTEALNTSMKLAERIDEFRDIEVLSERRGRMMHALGQLAPRLADPEQDGLPAGTMERLLEGGGRRMGSLLFFADQSGEMQEHEVVPAGRDLLNGAVAPGLGSVADRICREARFRVVEDMAGEIFFGTVPPGAQDLGSALVAPLVCDGTVFGGLVVYGEITNPAFDSAEKEYWCTAATLIGLSYHWRALRRKAEKGRVLS
jgi:signal recognition particle receptor subunit beta